MFRKKSLATLLLASMAWTGGAIQAQASPRPGPTSPEDLCSATDLASGACLTAVVSGGMSPLQAAVAQAIERGEDAKARHFVVQRRKSHSDPEQDVLERLLVGKPNPVTPAAAPGQGTVSGGTHTLTDYPTYLYCGPSGCTQVGKVKAEFRMTITFYPENTLSGDLIVQQGPSVDFTFLECLSRLDRNNLPDTTVHTWGNCPAAHNRDTWTTRALILGENWRQGGTRGQKYYNRYRLSFKTSAGSRPTFGPFTWETHRWYIPNTGGSPYWLT